MTIEIYFHYKRTDLFYQIKKNGNYFKQFSSYAVELLYFCTTLFTN